MAQIKLQADGLNLADTFAFTGTITGAGGGKVLQVVGSSSNFGASTTSNSYVDVTSSAGVAWEVALTPSATDSKILVVGHFTCQGYLSSSEDGRGCFQLMAKDGDGAYAEVFDAMSQIGGYTYDAGGSWIGDTHAVTWLHAPSSTNAITFKLQARNVQGSTVIEWSNNSSASHMTLMEVGA